MRLGKEKAAGYVEDTEIVPLADDQNDYPERTPATPEPEPALKTG